MTVYGGPHIITNELVLALDAGDVKSYPGDGSIWYDLCSNTLDASLILNPTFNSDKFVFNGINQYMDIGYESILNMDTDDMTTSVWINPSINTEYGCVYSKAVATAQFYRYALWITPWQTLYAMVSWDNTAHTRYDSSTFICDGNWKNVTTVYDRSDKLSIYINGILDFAWDISTYEGLDFVNINPFRIGAYTHGNNIIPLVNSYYKGDMSIYMHYKKALTQSEILQNYNALKSRFGL